MSKAEKFISEHTRKLTQYGHDYFLWVTPDDARKAVEIAREEMINKACLWLQEHKDAVETEDNGIAGWVPDYFIEDFKKEMEDVEYTICYNDEIGRDVTKCK